jgi:hypothetical protein
MPDILNQDLLGIRHGNLTKLHSDSCEFSELKILLQQEREY